MVRGQFASIMDVERMLHNSMSVPELIVTIRFAHQPTPPLGVTIVTMLQKTAKVQAQRQTPFKASRAVAVIKCVAKPKGARKQQQQQQQASTSLTTLGAAATGLLLPYLTEVQAAMAKGGEYGLLEGRSFALIHPIVMGSLFLGTGYAGYLGWQWRRVRELADEIKTLKKQIPAVVEGEVAVVSPVATQVAALEKVRFACPRRLSCSRAFHISRPREGPGTTASYHDIITSADAQNILNRN